MNKCNKEYFIIGCVSWFFVAFNEAEKLYMSPIFSRLMLGYIVFFILFSINCANSKNNKKNIFSKIIVILNLISAELILLIHTGSIAPFLLVIWATQLPEYFTGRLSILLVLLSNAVFALILAVGWNWSNWFVFSGLFLAFQMFAYSITASRNTEFRAREEVTQINQQLISTRILLAQSYKQEERLRISRDLHDIIGHKLTALSIQLELLEHKIGDEFYKDVKRIKNISKELLESIRKVVRDQREMYSLDISKAVEGVMELLPHLDLEIEGALTIESPQLAEQLVLCIQEGITNSIKHGNATKLRLSLHQQLNNIKIFLDDNGYGGLNKESCGSGIVGMNERLQLYKGRAELIPLVKGCRLLITLGDIYDYSCARG